MAKSLKKDPNELDPEEMTPLAYMVIETWRQTRPKAVKQLEGEGMLETIAARQVYEIAVRHEDLWKAGMSGPEAILEAESQLLHIPDIS